MLKIAYFSAEYSVADSLPIYAGGLGILAGDTIMEAGDEGLDFRAFGLVYHKAFTTGDNDQRTIAQRLVAEGFEYLTDESGQPRIWTVTIDGAEVTLGGWRKQYGQASLTLLDTNTYDNPPEWRAVTEHLYDTRPGMMLRQETVLGFGSVALMAIEGYEPDYYHLNEGHMAWVGLAAAIRRQQLHPKLTLTEALAELKPHFVATKHTIKHGGGLVLERQLIEKTLGPNLQTARGSVDDLMAIGGKDDGYFFATKFMLSIASRANGVSEIHVKAEKAQYPESTLIAVTNGIYAPRWRATNLDGDPLKYTDQDLWNAHAANRCALFRYVRQETGKQLHPERLTVVWARRITGYKRPGLLINDLDKLTSLVQDARQPVQIVIAGHANPADEEGLAIEKQIIAASKLPGLTEAFAYLPHYNPRTARLLVQGADLWLNTPLRGMEACGTSGMKASLNGALQFSTSDGWVDEIDLDSIGWALPEQNPEQAIYDTLEHDIAPLFYDRDAVGLPCAWIGKMRANIELIERQFTTERMLKDYYRKLYLS